jgi:DNA-binding CsgD family transcriptional regulator
MRHKGSMQASTLKYVTFFLIGSVVFFVFDIASDIYERIIAINMPSLLDLAHLVFEIFSAAALILAIRILLRQLRWLRARNSEQSKSLSFLRGEMDSFARSKFDQWNLTLAERDIAMYMLKGLSIAEIAAARSTAEGTIKAQTSNIFRKTGVASRMELMSLFMDEFLEIGAGLSQSKRQTG